MSAHLVNEARTQEHIPIRPPLAERTHLLPSPPAPFGVFSDTLSPLNPLINFHPQIEAERLEQIREIYREKPHTVFFLSTELEKILGKGVEIGNYTLYDYNPAEIKAMPGILERYNAHGAVEDIKELMYGTVNDEDIKDNGSTTVIAVNPTTKEIVGTIKMAGHRILSTDQIEESKPQIHEFGFIKDTSPENRTIEELVSDGLHDQLSKEGLEKTLYPFEIAGWTLFALAQDTKDPLDIYKALLIHASTLIDEENLRRKMIKQPTIKATICTLQTRIYNNLKGVTKSLKIIPDATHSQAVEELRRRWPLYWVVKYNDEELPEGRERNSTYSLEQYLTDLINEDKKEQIFQRLQESASQELGEVKKNSSLKQFNSLAVSSRPWKTLIKQMEIANGKGMSIEYIRMAHGIIAEILSAADSSQIFKLSAGPGFYGFTLYQMKKNLGII